MAASFSQNFERVCLGNTGNVAEWLDGSHLYLGSSSACFIRSSGVSGLIDGAVGAYPERVNFVLLQHPVRHARDPRLHNLFLNLLLSFFDFFPEGDLHFFPLYCDAAV